MPLPTWVPSQATATRPLSPAVADWNVLATTGGLTVLARSVMRSHEVPWLGERATIGWKFPAPAHASYRVLSGVVATDGSKPRAALGAPAIVYEFQLDPLFVEIPPPTLPQLLFGRYAVPSAETLTVP